MGILSDPVFLGFAGVVLFILFFMFIWLIPVRLWIAALGAGVHVPLRSLIGMRIRRVAPRHIVEPMITWW